MTSQDDVITPKITGDKVWQLIHMPKSFDNEKEPIVLTDGFTKQYDLHSPQSLDSFYLDISVGSISLKYTLQTRVYSTVCLIRYDYGGTHTNPKKDCSLSKNDPFYSIHDKCIGKKYDHQPHIHIYREGFDDKWAYPANEIIKNPSNISKSVIDFLDYCGVVKKPKIQEGLYGQYDR